MCNLLVVSLENVFTEWPVFVKPRVLPLGENCTKVSEFVANGVVSVHVECFVKLVRLTAASSAQSARLVVRNSGYSSRLMNGVVFTVFVRSMTHRLDTHAAAHPTAGTTTRKNRLELVHLHDVDDFLAKRISEVFLIRRRFQLLKNIGQFPSARLLKFLHLLVVAVSKFVEASAVRKRLRQALAAQIDVRQQRRFQFVDKLFNSASIDDGRTLGTLLTINRQRTFW